MRHFQMWRIYMLMLAALLAVQGVRQLRAQSPSKAELSLRAAIEIETVKGDLKKAIDEYKRLASNRDRTVAAKALLRMAGCYEKLGSTEARRVYERVVKEFADQKESAEQAKAQLSGPTGTAKLARSLFSGPQVDLSGSVSPDGRYVSFQANAAGGNSNLWVRELETGMVRQITDEKGGGIEAGYMSRFSPDGKQVAYSWADWNQGHGRHELRITPVDNPRTARTLITRPEFKFSGPMAWSPDGKWIVTYFSIDPKGDQFGVVSVADGSMKILADDVDFQQPAFFSPDSKYLAVTVN